MSKVCEVCGRGPRRSQKRSHSLVKTKIWQYINLQSRKIDGIRKKVCVKCIKTAQKTNK